MSVKRAVSRSDEQINEQTSSMSKRVTEFTLTVSIMDRRIPEQKDKLGNLKPNQDMCIKTGDNNDETNNAEMKNEKDEMKDKKAKICVKRKAAKSSKEVPRLQLDMTPLKDAKLPVIWVLGGPGSGKGTQCVKIVEKFGYTHISSGDLLRAEVASGSELGKACQAIMKTGSLVPSGVIMDLMKKAILDAVSTSKGYLIDGMPRELAQAKMFEDEISACTAVLSFEVPDSVLKDRLLERGKDSGRVDDQNEETIKNRLDTFHQISEPVIQAYASKCTKIEANRPVDVVFADVEKFLQGLA